MSKKTFFQDTIAIVYDFDGTLSPQPASIKTVEAGQSGFLPGEMEGKRP